MRKITNKILFLVISLITLYLCGCENPTIYEEKTIIVNIESDVIPEVISSFGEGSLDETSMVYTHKIPYIKNLTLHFFKDGYKTEELFISTSEMEADTIEKTISFGNSLEAIIEVEKRQRRYYSGYLGGVKENNTFSLFVNLRSMEIFPNRVQLYVGGGLTSQSKVEDEWNETEHKAQTLLYAIKE